MAGAEEIHHNIKTITIGLKSAAELLPTCPADKRDKVIALMRKSTRDIERLLTELEAELK